MSWLARQEEYYAKGRIGHMSVMLTLQSCIGGISAMMSIGNDAWILVSLSAILAMASNSMFLANMKPKVCIVTFLASVIFSGAVLLMWIAIGTFPVG